MLQLIYSERNSHPLAKNQGFSSSIHVLQLVEYPTNTIAYFFTIGSVYQVICTLRSKKILLVLPSIAPTRSHLQVLRNRHPAFIPRCYAIPFHFFQFNPIPVHCPYTLSFFVFGISVSITRSPNFNRLLNYLWFPSIRMKLLLTEMLLSTATQLWRFDYPEAEFWHQKPQEIRKL